MSFPIFAVVYIVGLLLLIIVGARIQYVIVRQRKRRCADEFRCLNCGVTLGAAALELAREKWREEIDELQEKDPGEFFEFLRPPDAICVNCGERYTYRSKENDFVKEINHSEN